ncbi:hypothetical protein [Cronobacter sakazakii]|uniref:hypothetical protein n=1 Tax=Cronobacter sakazakii TaxID=28141 RepID=UPI000A163EF9|nr:hypothetical protein [Cronobacter sakazakii]
MDKSREQFEYEAGKALCLPTSIIELARKGDGYDHAFDSMNIMQPLNGWWVWWKKSRAAVEIELPKPAYQRYEIQAIANHTIHKCKRSIISAGLKVKGE